MEIHVNNKPHSVMLNRLTGSELKEYLSLQLGLDPKVYYILNNGRRIEDHHIIITGSIHVIPKVAGGKGGFGSMLRAIGAQIEKTTNREACRDLSGRRLRDINEEQRLKNWINQQAEREKEAKERKKKKLEKLCEKPKHKFQDAEYDKERSELPEKVEDALLQGLQASCSTKRKITDRKEPIKKKKPKLWVDDELDDDISSSEDENEGDTEEKKSSSENVKNSESGNSKSSISASTSNYEAEDNRKSNSEKVVGNEHVES